MIKANLLEEGSFDSVVDGCECVFHTASPFYHAVTDPQVLFVFLFHLFHLLGIPMTAVILYEKKAA